MKFEKYLEYASLINLNEKGVEWVNTILKNYLEKNEPLQEVDGKKIKENTFYKLQNGEFTEVI